MIEDFAANSQCGFRASRRWFCVFVKLWRRLLSIMAKFFSCLLIFIKHMILPLWCVLQKYGVPNCLVDLPCSFHDGMAATVLVGGEDATPFEVRNGLRQGCTIAPTLFI